ncbi:hypothetical protein E6O75_ATG10046 [Venturia nashicola]|uniref:Uncharacterized protein n=1 Tax=Venturia nashicola TaxID=86259 RepID=A0A4Z1P0Y3_9PEZI|nr:hypothetical protein E6O75_ATG10046 [Venturia nashicola]
MNAQEDEEKCDLRPGKQNLYKDRERNLLRAQEPYQRFSLQRTHSLESVLSALSAPRADRRSFAGHISAPLQKAGTEVKGKCLEIFHNARRMFFRKTSFKVQMMQHHIYYLLDSIPYEQRRLGSARNLPQPIRVHINRYNRASTEPLDRLHLIFHHQAMAMPTELPHSSLFVIPLRIHGLNVALVPRHGHSHSIIILSLVVLAVMLTVKWDLLSHHSFTTAMNALSRNGGGNG